MKRNRLLKVLMVGALLFGGYRLYLNLTDDFRVGNIKEDLPYKVEWETTPLSLTQRENLDLILDQRYTYLAKGAQSYVFESDDGRYVLKFFKFKHARPSLLVKLLPPISYLNGYKRRHFGKKRRKLLGPFRGYKLAHDELRRETGLIAVHLNKTKDLKKKVQIKDKIGFVRSLPLDDVVFIVQERATPAPDELSRLLDEGDVLMAKERIRSLETLLRHEYYKKIGDYDRCTLKNVGFVGDRAIRLDVGMLYRDPGMRDPEEELESFRREVANWVTNHYPQFREELL